MSKKQIPLTPQVAFGEVGIKGTVLLSFCFGAVSLTFEVAMAQNIPFIGDEPARPTTLWCQVCLRHAHSAYTVNIHSVIDPAVCVFSQASSSLCERCNARNTTCESVRLLVPSPGIQLIV